MTVIFNIFKHINLGENYEELADACEFLGKRLASPAMYSATRFANNVRQVYANFRKNFTAFIQCLERTKTEMRDGNSKDRERAAKKFMHSICNFKFVLTLSSLIDIYDKYGELINVIQKVNSLPHERYDSFTQGR